MKTWLENSGRCAPAQLRPSMAQAGPDGLSGAVKGLCQVCQAVQPRATCFIMAWPVQMRVVLAGALPTRGAGVAGSSFVLREHFDPHTSCF